jgi:hypothetical protein
MSLEPGSNKLPLMYFCVIQDEIDGCLGCRNFLQLGKKGYELNFSFAQAGARIDLPSAGIEGRKQVQGTHTLVLMLQASWLVRSHALAVAMVRALLRFGPPGSRNSWQSATTCWSSTTPSIPPRSISCPSWRGSTTSTILAGGGWID